MRERPTGDELLETARTVLREELIAALPADKRHAALMVANALSIAARQLQMGDAPQRTELAALERLLSEPCAANGDDPVSVREALIAANRKLAHWIRSGRADTGRMRDEVRDHLAGIARQKVAESNPKYLGGNT